MMIATLTKVHISPVPPPGNPSATHKPREEGCLSYPDPDFTFCRALPPACRTHRAAMWKGRRWVRVSMSRGSGWLRARRRRSAVASMAVWLGSRSAAVSYCRWLFGWLVV